MALLYFRSADENLLLVFIRHTIYSHSFALGSIVYVHVCVTMSAAHSQLEVWQALEALCPLAHTDVMVVHTIYVPPPSLISYRHTLLTTMVHAFIFMGVEPWRCWTHRFNTSRSLWKKSSFTSLILRR